MPCPDPNRDSKELLNALKKGCDSFSETLDLLTIDCRTPTKRVVPKYALISLGDSLGRNMSLEDFSLIRNCWRIVKDEGRTVLAVALSRLAMICPETAHELTIDLEDGEGWHLLARWVYPILGIWDITYLESIKRRDLYLLSWVWYAKYVPEDFELALEKVISMSDIIDRTLIIALKELKKVNEVTLIERLKNKPSLFKKVIP